MGPTAFAFATALLVNFVDSLGMMFLVPVILPYGKLMGASDPQIAFFSAIRGFCMFLSNIWLSKLSDKTTRRTAILVSMAGSIVGYALQAESLNLPESVLVFTVARGLGGLFAGTAPVLQAFVADLFAHDKEEMRQKLVVLQASSQGFSLVLAPIAGSLGSLSVQLPFWCAAGAGSLGALWVICFMPKKIRRGGLSSESLVASEAAAGGEAGGEEGRSKAGSPFKDPVVLVFLLALLGLAVTLTGIYGYLLPNMLYTDPRFGLNTGTEEEVAKRVANMVGLLTLPNGIVSIFFSVFLFVPLTRRFGEEVCLLSAGFVGALSYPLFALSSQIWHLALCQAMNGVAGGMLIPCVGPVVAKYAEAFYPTQKAQTQAVPMMGFALGMMLGQSLVQLEQQMFGTQVAWFIASGTLGAAAAMVTVGAAIINRRVSAQRRDLTSGQQKVFSEERGEDPDAFLQRASAKVAAVLQARKPELWNAPVQALVLQRIEALVPSLAEWDEATGGREYMQGLYGALQSAPNMPENFEDLFPEQAREEQHVALLHQASHGHELGVHADAFEVWDLRPQAQRTRPGTQLAQMHSALL